ncbi:SusC/RagA family TonB-linked outer membrane protein [Polaribacter staleyi]|uniref:SusC/RagA family TonB-linked outer membrane protein n=1 Tax=Polaribacter staleyi TaxID=2022337 RepID=UPI0031BB40A9
MKATIFLLCFSVFSITPNNVLSQNAKVKIEENKNVTVDEVFDLIMSQTDYTFIYQVEMFKNLPKVSLKKGVISANKLLEKSLSNGHFDLNFTSKNTIIIKKTENKLQETIITGTVVDRQGLPIPGITVYVSDREPAKRRNSPDFIIRGTTTDFDGKFSIKAKVGYYIVANGLGYQMSVQQVTLETQYTITLKEEISQLDEVVVISSGFKEISKERVTGAYESISKSQLDKPASSIAERLGGVVAGLQSVVDADGNTSFQIRGLSTLGADRDPLIVLNGFPIEGGFETINPNDVESVTVLKDAAAASIWGAKAANGVIVVTTKKNRARELNVSVSSFVRFSPKLDTDYTLNNASNEDHIEYLKLAFDGTNFGSGFRQPDEFGITGFNTYSNIYTTFYNGQFGVISLAERDVQLARLVNLDNSNQIKDHLLQTPMVQQFNINISGGNKKMSNSLSLLYEDNKDYFQGNKINKYLINFNNSSKLSNRLQFNFSGMLQYNDETRNGVDLGTLSELSRADMLMEEDGSLSDLSYLRNNLYAINQVRPDANLYPYGGNLFYNPISEIKNRDRGTKRLNARIQTGLTLDILKGLDITSSIQYEVFDTKQEDIYNEETYDVRAAVIKSTTPNPAGGVLTQNVPSGSILQRGTAARPNARTNAYIFRNQLNFDRTFADKHHISFLAGTQSEERVFKTTINPTSFGYNPATLQSSGNVPSNILTLESWAGQWLGFYPISVANQNLSLIPFGYSSEAILTEDTDRFFSYYANLGYTFDDKYTITGNYRNDASNLIADDSSIRSNPFWSVGLAWKAHKESFLANSDWLNRLNFRTTYGYGGNVDTSTSAIPTLGLNPTADPVTGELTSSVANVGNPLLRWERTRQLNLGVDFTLFNNKLNGSVNYYNKKGTDLIVSQSIPSVNGNTTATINNGEMVNKGFEIELGTTLPIKGNDIIWNASMYFSHNDNEITKFFKTTYNSFEYTGALGPSGAYTENYNANTLWSFEYAGVQDFNGTAAPAYYAQDREFGSFLGRPTGDVSQYMLASGTSVAPTIISTRQSFKIYDFNLSFIVAGKFGHKFRRTSFNYESQTFRSINSSVSEALNAGDGSEIAPIISDSFLYFRYSNVAPFLNYSIVDASLIRLQEINLSYNLPISTTNKLGINSLQLYLQGNNLGTILFNDFGEDPEYPRGSIRPQALYTLGFNLNF